MLNRDWSAVAMLLLFFAFAVAGHIVESSGAFHQTINGIDEFTRSGSSIRQWIHSSAAVALAVLILVVIDSVFLPWLKIRDVARGRDGWEYASPYVRAAIIIGWFILAFAIVSGITQGVLAL